MTNPAADLNPLTWRSDIAAAIAAEAAAEWDAVQAREHAARAHQAALEGAALAEANAAAESAVAAVSGAEPPDSIAVDTNGLSPGRARLVRFVAWLAALEAEHAALTEGRTAYLTAQKVPVLTREKIDAITKADTDGLISLMAASGKGISTHQLRTRERAELQKRLAHDEYEASVAVDALIEVDAKLDKLSVQIEALKARHKEFVADALAEAVAGNAGDKLIARMDALHADALRVMGGAQALQVLRGVAVLPKRHDVLLPVPRLDTDRWITGSDDGPGHYSGGAGYMISFELHEQMAEQRAWLDKANALLADPHADIGDDA